MPNFLENLRLRNLFDPSAMGQNPMQQPYDNISFGPTNVPMPTPDAGSQEFDPIARMKKLYTPESAASDRFNAMLAAQPQYQQPSGMRRVGGAVLGALTDLGTNFGGNRAGVHGTDVFDETTGRHKYERAIEDWKTGLTPAQAAANLERQNNMNERQLATSTVNQELVNRRDADKSRIADEKTKIQQQRADVYKFKAEHPEWKLVVGKGGTVKAFNPQTKEVHDTGIPTGTLSDIDKLDMLQEDALEKIGAQGSEARKTEDKRQTGRMEVVGARGSEARKTKETPSASATAKTETPQATKVRQYNTAREFAAKNPKLAKFIKFGKGNDFTISSPAKGGFFSSAGPTENEHKQITDAIFGTDIPVNQPTRTGATTPSNAQNAKPNTESKKGVRVKAPNGQTGTYKGTAEEAKKAGYQVIG